MTARICFQAGKQLAKTAAGSCSQAGERMTAHMSVRPPRRQEETD
ncbi:hypothetical protein [Drancourtella sp. An12]|nr:hypothetical protein [Drancourtella sp. An12]